MQLFQMPMRKEAKLFQFPMLHENCKWQTRSLVSPYLLKPLLYAVQGHFKIFDGRILIFLFWLLAVVSKPAVCFYVFAMYYQTAIKMTETFGKLEAFQKLYQRWFSPQLDSGLA